MTEHEKLDFEIKNVMQRHSKNYFSGADNPGVFVADLCYKLQDACEAIDETREEIEKLKIRNKSLVEAIYSLSSGINILYSIENNKKNNGECWLQQPSIPDELLK